MTHRLIQRTPDDKSYTDAASSPAGINLRRQLLLPLIALLGLLTGAIVAALYVNEQSHLDESFGRELHTMQADYSETVGDHSDELRAMLSLLARDPELPKTLLAGNREQLLASYSPLFEQLKRDFNITHFYFLDAGRVTLLRLHQPPRFGDRIDRFTAREAERTHQTVTGIELGPLGTLTLRAVMPVYQADQLIGYVELGEEMQEVVLDLAKTFNSEGYLLLHKEHLSRPDWEQGMRMLGRTANWDRFPETILAAHTKLEAPDELGYLSIEGNHLHLSPTITLDDQGLTYRVGFIPLNDATGRHVGDLAVLRDVSTVITHTHQVMFTAAAVAVIASLLLFSLFFVLLGRTERNLATARKQLIEESAAREALQAKHMEELQQEIAIRQQAEAILAKSNASLEHLLSTSPVIIYTSQANDNYAATFISKNVQALLGHSAQNFVDVQNFWIDHIHPDDRARVLTELAEALKSDHHEYEYRFMDKDGHYHCLHDGIRILHDAEGRPTEIVGYCADITEQKRMEAAWQEAQQRLALHFDQTPMGIIEFTPDSRIISWNPAAEKIFGYREEEMLDQQPMGLIVPPELAEHVNNLWQELLAGKYHDHSSNENVTKDGRRIFCEWYNTCLRDADGKIIGVVSLVNDATEQRTAEAARSRAEAKYRTLFDSSSDAIMLLDDKGFIDCNEATLQMFGCRSREEFLHKHPADFSPTVQPDGTNSLELANRRIATAVTQGSNQFEWIHKRLDGTEFIAEVWLTATKLDGENLVQATVRDISERKRTAESLQKSQASLSEAQHLAQLGNWELDLVNNVLTWSDEIYRIFEFDPKEFKATYEAFLDAIHPADRETVNQAYTNSLKNKTPYEIVHRLLMKDGRIKYVRERCHTDYDNTGQPLRSLGTVQDITSHHRSLLALQTLSSCNSTLIHTTDENELLNKMCQVIVNHGYRLAWFGFVERDEAKSIRPVAYAGYEEGYLESLHISWADNEYGRGPSGHAVRQGKPQIIRNIATDPQYSPWREQAIKRGYASSLSIPLKAADDEVFAILNVYSAENDAFDKSEVDLLVELADDLAYGILTLRTRKERDHYQYENIKSGERLKQALTDTIRAISLTVEKRDPYTSGHQSKVAELCVAIGRELGLDEERIEGLHLGATIHDIGKIYIPAEILNRPGRLSEYEFELVKTHSQVGYDIVKDVKFPWPVAEMILQHHERLDGSGYPQGLEGEAIILEARIIAVADVVEAITSHRPYRPALENEVAFAEITGKRGKSYDPAVVDACLHLMRDKGFTFSKGDKI